MEHETDELQRHPKRIHIGFAIFDAVHIVCAIVLLILAFEEPMLNSLAIAECNVEIGFSLLLIVFIASLVEHTTNKAMFRSAYNFAWLTAMGSVMIPLSFSLPVIVTSAWSTTREVITLTLDVAAMLICFLSFLMFLFSIINSHNIRRWRLAISFAMFASFPLAAICFAEDLMLDYTPAALAFELIKDLAPLAPAILGLTLWNSEVFKA